AGVEIAVGGEDTGVVLLIEIAGRYARALHHDNADLIGGAVALDVPVVVELDDADVGVRNTQAGRAAFRIAVARRLGDVVGGVGGAVGEQHRYADGSLDLRAGLGGNRGRAGRHVTAQGREVLAGRLALGELRQRGRHAGEDGDLEAVDELPVVLDEALVAR